MARRLTVAKQGGRLTQAVFCDVMDCYQDPVLRISGLATVEVILCRAHANQLRINLQKKTPLSPKESTNLAGDSYVRFV